MRVAIRADATTHLGTGHVMRCLALADELRSRGAHTRFLCRAIPGHLGEVLMARGHPVIDLGDDSGGPTEDARQCAAMLHDEDWLVVDHYGLGADWEMAMRRSGRHLLAIDDLGRAHDCDLLLDQNLKPGDAYVGRVPPACRVLIGPAFALLRASFQARRGEGLVRDGEVRRLLVLFGGGDALDLTDLTLDALDRLGRPALVVEVVVGSGHPQLARIRARCRARRDWRMHVQAEDVAGLMASSDLAIGAAGISTWERACVGLPALVITFADNQQPIAAAAQAAGLLTWLGDARAMTPARLADRLLEALADALVAPARLHAQSRAGLALVDGAGCRRVAEAMGG